jgi:hypothetical protein
MATPSKRTTVNRKDHVDLDAILAEKGLTPRMAEDIETFTMDLFGEKNIRVMKTTNMFNLMMFGSDDNDDTARSVKSIIEMVHPDDQRRFKAALAKVSDLSAEALTELIAAMLSGATGANPTSSRSGSGRTARASISAVPSEAN